MDYYFDAKNVCVLLEDLNATQRERQDSASMFKGRKSRRPFFHPRRFYLFLVER